MARKGHEIEGGDLRYEVLLPGCLTLGMAVEPKSAPASTPSLCGAGIDAQSAFPALGSRLATLNALEGPRETASCRSMVGFSTLEEETRYVTPILLRA